MARHSHQPTSDDLIGFDLWGSQGWCNQEVVGESHYLPALQGLFARGGTQREELELTALLVPEPTNRHDPNAVAVHVDGTIVGYLPREVAGSYQPMLLDLIGRGLVARVPCRVWGGTFTDYDYDRNDRLVQSERFNASVRVALAEPHLCLPVNAAPGRHVLLPRGSAIQVTGEDQHMPAIAPYLRPEGECFAYATLHEVDEATGRGSKQRVEVCLDNRPVGLLTPKMSGDLLPAIRHLSTSGHVTAAMAKVKGNALKAEVILYCARAHELPADWVSGVADASPLVPETEAQPAVPMPDAVHPPIPPKPTRIRFAAPPTWPAPPDGWEPPPGWQPDPTWPPAPPGWQFWVAE